MRAMENKVPFIAGAAVLTAVGIGYFGWRQHLRELPDAIERVDLEGADALADELFEAGQLGREVRVLAGLLAFCLVAMWLTSQTESPTVVVEEVASEAFGFGSYL